MKRILLVFATLLLVAVGIAVWAIQSGWLDRKIHARLITEIENATGGRVTVGAYGFDWRTMRAELRGLTIHGLEPSDAAPLFQAQRIVAGVKIISLWQRKFELLSLDAEAPQVNVLVAPDGRTNIPEPRVRRVTGAPMARFLDLAISRYRVTQGAFHLGERQWPLEAQGKDLDLQLDFDRAARGYAGHLSAKDMRIVEPLRMPLMFDLDAAVRMEATRLSFSTANFRSGHSAIKATKGEIALDHRFASAHLEGVMSLTELGPVLGLPVEHQGEARVQGMFQWNGGRDLTAAGTAQAT